MLAAGLADAERLGQPETKASFRHKAYFFLARGVRSGCASGGADDRTNCRALASAYQRSHKRTASGASADEGEVTFLVTAAAHKDAIGLERHALTFHRDRRKSNAQVAGVVQMSGFAGRHNLTHDRRALRSQGLSVHDQGLIEHGGKILSGLRGCAGDGLLQSNVDSSVSRHYQRLAFCKRQRL